METKDVIAAGRLRLGLTHQAFADKVGVSRGAVQQWEKGSTAPTRKHQPLIAKLLGITVAELLCVTTTTGPSTSADSIKSPTLAQALEAIDAALEPLDSNSREIAVGMLSGLKLPGNHEMVASMLNGAIAARKAHTKDLVPKPDEQTQETPISPAGLGFSLFFALIDSFACLC